MFKSIKTGVLAAILISTAVISHAQKKITEGTITYDAKYDLKPEQQAIANMLPSETKVKFNGSLSKMQLEQGPAMITILNNAAEKTGLLLIDVPIAQKQIAVKMNKAELEKAEAEAGYTDFKATGEKQTISNYNAEKYTYKTAKGDNFELWATTDLDLPLSTYSQHFSGVKGVPVKFTIIQNGVKMTLTLKDIKEEKIDGISLAVPSGYDEMTMDDLKAMQGGGQ